MSPASTANTSKASENRTGAATAEHKSKSVPEVGDPRVVRTNEAIGAAFVALLHRRPYTRIRVSDITRKAKIGRATFYAHFQSKDALLAAQLADIVMPMIEPLDEAACLVDATRLFAHILSARTIYSSLCAGAGRVVGERIIQDAMQARVAALIARRPMAVRATPPAPFVPRFVAATLLALIEWSLEQQPAPSATELQAALRTLVGRALAPEP